MAFDVRVITADPYWLRYLVGWDGAGDDFMLIPNTRLLEDMWKNGPLYNSFNVSGLTIPDMARRFAPTTDLGAISVDLGRPVTWTSTLSVDLDGRPLFGFSAAGRGEALVWVRNVHTLVR